MGQARLRIGIWAGVALAGGMAQAAGPSRFASYGTEADCVAARSFTPAACHAAFANARVEYEARTPSFPSLALCTRRYGSCMAWPGGGTAGFRPAWDGVDIVDTPGEHSVTPSPGATGRTVRFAARSLDDGAAPLVIRRAEIPVSPRRASEAAPPGGRPRSPAAAIAQAPPGSSTVEKTLPPIATPPAGSGFKLEDGVLTYPAPARYQTKNLPKD